MITETEFPESAGAYTGPHATVSSASPEAPSAPADPHTSTAVAGRPSAYSLELAQAFCAEVACGRSLRDICGDERMPDARTIFRWLSARPEFRTIYDIARASACDAIVADILELADAQPAYIEEPGKHGGIVRRVDAGAVQHNRVRIDTKRWLLSKLRPERYGDQIALTGAQGKDLIPARPAAPPFTAEEVSTLVVGMLTRARPPETLQLEGKSLVTLALEHHSHG